MQNEDKPARRHGIYAVNCMPGPLFITALGSAGKVREGGYVDLYEFEDDFLDRNREYKTAIKNSWLLEVYNEEELEKALSIIRQRLPMSDELAWRQKRAQIKEFEKIYGDQSKPQYGYADPLDMTRDLGGTTLGQMYREIDNVNRR